MNKHDMVKAVLETLEESLEESINLPEFKENFDVKNASDQEFHNQLWAIWIKDKTLDAARKMYEINPLIAAYIHCMNQRIAAYSNKIAYLAEHVECKA